MICGAMADPSGETSTSPLAAEAASLHRSGGCDGTDTHVLGWSGRLRAALLVIGVALVWLVSTTRQLSGFEPLAWGLLLGVALAAGMSTSVVGDELRVNRFGWRRRIRFASVSRVERYEYRSSVSLRLWDAGDDRLPSIPISGLGYRISPAAAAHALRYLDQPDVGWAPSAWATLRNAAGSAQPHPTSADPGSDIDHSAYVEVPAPRGRLVSGKPLGGWAKLGVYFSVVMSAIAVVVLIVLVPVTWRGYLESQRVQHGPSASATLLGENITETSGRSGTHHTTHFLVTFTTEAGQQVTTTVKAHGRYGELTPGFHFLIRYDPRSPRHAELPGRPMNSLTTALLVTILAGVAVVTVGSIGTAVVFAGRRRR